MTSYLPTIGQLKYIGLPLVILSVYWPIIGHLYCIKSFFTGTIKRFFKKIIAALIFKCIFLVLNKQNIITHGLKMCCV